MNSYGQVYHDEGSRLAAITRAAVAHRHALEGGGVPVPTAVRVAAADAVDAALKAEAAYWAGRADRDAQITALLDILDAHNAHIDFEPDYRIIYGYFAKISEARAALLAVRAVKPAAAMTVDGTKATITIDMGGE